MIIDIPTQADYENTACSFLNLAWENTLKLVMELDWAKACDNNVADKAYWDACQSQLATSISLVQQAFEFLLKARIIGVSPYLLISGSSRDWPNKSATEDKPFAEFYMIDAKDLIRIHDTVSCTRLPKDIKELFEEMRKLRNSIVHTVDKRLKFGVERVLCTILKISEWSFGVLKWMKIRNEYISKSSSSIAFEGRHDEELLIHEIINVVDILPPSEVIYFFGFDKKQRRYICPSCSSACGDSEFRPNLAFLVPNTPTSTNLHCYICGNDFAVIREYCQEEDCNGNVLYKEDNCCLICYSTP